MFVLIFFFSITASHNRRQVLFVKKNDIGKAPSKLGTFVNRNLHGHTEASVLGKGVHGLCW